MEKNLLPQIQISSYNPYESRYPGRRVVSRDVLHLIKILRENGFTVIIQPEDGTKLNYSTQKGFGQFLADPVHALLVGVPVGVVVNLISSWLYDRLKRKPLDEEVNIALDVNESGGRIRYNHNGKPISEKKFQLMLKVLERRVERYGKSWAITPPDPSRPVPIYLEHTDKLVGWGRVRLDEKGLKIEDATLLNRKTRRKVEKGALQGASIAGLIHKATCSICNLEYVDCNHIAKQEYDGKVCTVNIAGIDLAEISIVSQPVQPSAKVAVVKAKKKSKR